MTWSSKPPTEPGRYWWRQPSRFPEHPELTRYGLMLIAWDYHTLMPEYAPKLACRSRATFSMGNFEGEHYHGWAGGGGGAIEGFGEGPAEFWSIPERGPEGFLPELPGKPDWTPPDPVIRAAERAAADKAAKARDRKEAAEIAKRIADAKAAGTRLFVCQECDQMIDEGDLIQVRRCPHCDENFNGTDNGQACPICNRRFSSNVTEQGCMDCCAECEPMDETPAPAVVEKKRRRR